MTAIAIDLSSQLGSVLRAQRAVNVPDSPQEPQGVILPPVGQRVWEPLPGSQTRALQCPASIILFDGTRGPGKRVFHNTPILTDSGWKIASEVTLTDKLVSIDGTYTDVLEIYSHPDRPLNRILFDDGAEVIVDDEHLWKVYDNKNEKWHVRDTLTIREGIAKGSSVRHIPLLEAPAPGKQWTGYDPYVIGVVIGDGTMKGKYPTVYSPEPEIEKYLCELGWRSYRYEYRRGGVKQISWIGDKNLLADQIPIEKGDKKYVPTSLLEADPDSRLAVLQGLMDTDGHCDKEGRCEFKSVSLQLAKDVQYLVRSLGGKSNFSKQIVSLQDGFGTRGYIYRIKVTHCGKFKPFRLPRHVNRLRMGQHGIRRRIESITPIGNGPGVCFSVAHESKLFVIKDFVVTHNTDCQLMRYRRNVGMGYGKFWRGVIFDREYKNLDDLIAKSQRWFPQMNDGARFLRSSSDLKWVWPTGEELLFRAFKKESDYWGYHGQEFPFIGWNELTKYPNENCYELMMSCNRSSFLPEKYPIVNRETGEKTFLPEIPLEVFSTTNPFGVGYNWVKKKFINVAPAGKLVRKITEVFNPRTQKKIEITRMQCRIHGSYKENKYLNPEYIAELHNITDPNKRKAWLDGSWDIVSGGMFDDVWDTRIHSIEPFQIPLDWKIDRSFDWGSAKPFSVGWWAESNGSDIRLKNGRTKSTVKGDLFRIGEWYGTSGKVNEGLRMLAKDVAIGIIERELAMRIHSRVVPGPADNSIFDLENGNDISRDMRKPLRVNGRMYRGIMWQRSDKASGARKAGWLKCRDMLSNSFPPKHKGPREYPGLFVFNTCNYFLDLFPTLPRDEKDPDDVDTEAEDHLGDEVRYRVLHSGRRAKTGNSTIGLGG